MLFSYGLLADKPDTSLQQAFEKRHPGWEKTVMSVTRRPLLQTAISFYDGQLEEFSRKEAAVQLHHTPP